MEIEMGFDHVDRMYAAPKPKVEPVAEAANPDEELVDKTLATFWIDSMIQRFSDRRPPAEERQQLIQETLRRMEGLTLQTAVHDTILSWLTGLHIRFRTGRSVNERHYDTAFLNHWRVMTGKLYAAHPSVSASVNAMARYNLRKEEL